MDYAAIAHIIVALMGIPSLALSLTVRMAIYQHLMLGVAHQGVAFPGMVFADKRYPHRGWTAVSTISVFPRTTTACLTADREFAGQGGFVICKQNHTPFFIRIRENYKLDDRLSPKCKTVLVIADQQKFSGTKEKNFGATGCIAAALRPSTIWLLASCGNSKRSKTVDCQLCKPLALKHCLAFSKLAASVWKN